MDDVDVDRRAPDRRLVLAWQARRGTILEAKRRSRRQARRCIAPAEVLLDDTAERIEDRRKRRRSRDHFQNILFSLEQSCGRVSAR